MISTLGWYHVAFAIIAIIDAAILLLLPKGTSVHRLFGWIYVLAMASLNITALSLYRLTGHFGPFHFAAIVSLVTIAAGVITAIRRRPRWMERHYYWMTWSYVGLLAALVAEVGSRLDIGNFWVVVVLLSVAVLVAGGRLIKRNAARVLGSVRLKSRPVGA